MFELINYIVVFFKDLFRKKKEEQTIPELVISNPSFTYVLVFTKNANLSVTNLVVNSINSSYPNYVNFILSNDKFYLIDNITNELVKISKNNKGTITIKFIFPEKEVKSKYVKHIYNDIHKRHKELKLKELAELDKNYDDEDDAFV